MLLTAVAGFALGLLLLLLGADSFLKGASGVALRYGISPFVIGLTIVGFGTSAPELTVNLLAAWRGSYDLALGNDARVAEEARLAIRRTFSKSRGKKPMTVVHLRRSP